MTSALVLSGGGVTGIAWEIGVLLGMRDAGVNVTPDLVVGTSAGSTVGAQLLSGTDLEDLYARQVSEEHAELTPDLDIDRLLGLAAALGDLSRAITAEQAAHIGVWARETSTVGPEVRRAVITARLPSHTWPSVPLLLTAVDADTGEVVVLDRGSGIPLVDAVMASCAVPCVWPPVPLHGRVLIDGGVRSPTHCWLAQGCDEVLVLAPLGPPSIELVTSEIEALRSGGTRTLLVSADAESLAAMGPNALDPARRAAAAAAGRRQGRLTTGLLQS